jgi:uncharacterized membrane protein
VTTQVGQEPLAPAVEPSLRPFGVGLLVLGAIGLMAAFELTVDKIRILRYPSFVPGCDWNPVLSCGSVMRTDQAEVFGFPNPLMGLIGFAVVITMGAVLAGGARPARGLLVGLAIGSLAGAAFVHWLAFQSLYRIGALCPWCLVVWAVTIPVAVWSGLVAWREIRPSPWAERLWSVRYLLVLAWYLAVVVLALVRFWSYWRTLL